MLRDLVVLVGMALVLAYLLDPLVTALERVRVRRWSVGRGPAAALVILAIVAAVVWIMVLMLPRVGAEFARFAQGAPANAERLLGELRLWAQARGLGPYADPALDQLRADAPQVVNALLGALGGWIGRALGGLSQILGLLLLPFLVFYLVAEREAVERSAMRFMPEETHVHVRAAAEAVDQALRSYVRGQAVVCLFMGLFVGAALTIVGFPYAILLGLVAAIAEVLPYVGFWVVALAIGLVGFGISAWMAVLGIAVYLVVNTLSGVLVTPRVMGQHLKMHPFVITISVLAGGKLLGPAGAILALPGAAVIQALVGVFAPRRAKAKTS
jgi:predicted PurR-regulated permease PerM